MEPHWYKNAVLYALDVDRFYDSNGDGVGDFPGAIEKLEYLADLGVTCIWMLPFYVAPNRDNGYDIQNYYGVDPRLGTLDDYVRFVRMAGERGIRVIIDLVMNHTSDQHPWFQAARHDPQSIYRSFYTWTDSPPPTPPGEGTIFPGEEHSVWTYDELAGAYYYHKFYHFQPDLNFNNPMVQDQVRCVLDFWLSFGVAGFRVDAAPHMISANGASGKMDVERHEILKELRAYVEGRKPGAVLLGETDVEPQELVHYFGDGDELTMLFNFALNNFIYLALARGSAQPVIEVLRQLPAIPPSAQWANFLRNLDEVDLERLTDAEREEVFKQFAPQEDMRIFGRGMRRRLAPILEGDRARLELAYSLLFAAPGTPTIVYGDEIGMGEDLEQHGRKSVRTPMQWSAERNGGFSTAKPGDLVQPMVKGGGFGYEQTNVAAQRSDAGSLWHFIRRMVHIRRQCPELGNGNWNVMDVGLNEVLALRCQWKDGIVLTLHNFSKKKQAVKLDLHDQRGRRLHNILDGAATQIEEDGISEVPLEPYGYRWYRISGERSGSVE